MLNGKSLLILVTQFERHGKELQAVLDALGALTDKAMPGAPQDPARALKNFYGVKHPLYFKNASAGLYRGFAEIRGCIAEVLETVTRTPGLIYQVNTLGGKIADPGLAAGSCFPHRDRPFLSELQAYWETPGREAKLLESFRAIQRRFSRHGITAQYGNYPDIELANWETAYYGESVTRLRAVKRRYDPENIFRHEQSVKP